MAKPRMFRRRKYTAVKGLRGAEKLESKAGEPGNMDDPKWLKRRADYLRRWSEKKQAANVRRKESRRKASRKSRG